MTWARGYLNRSPQQFHQCQPTRWQTKAMRAIEFDEWTCAVCGKVRVLRYRKNGYGEWVPNWELAEAPANEESNR